MPATRTVRLQLQMETEATSLHVRLLREAVTGRTSDGDSVGVVAEQSGLFLTIVGDMRRVHSHIATLAYPTLNRLNNSAIVPAQLPESDETNTG